MMNQLKPAVSAHGMWEWEGEFAAVEVWGEGGKAIGERDRSIQRDRLIPNQAELEKANEESTRGRGFGERQGLPGPR